MDIERFKCPQLFNRLKKRILRLPITSGMTKNNKKPVKNDFSIKTNNFCYCPSVHTEAEFKEFEPRLIFKPGLKYSWFH